MSPSPTQPPGRIQVPKNAKGGVLVCEDDIKAAFEFFDVEGKGAITASALRKRLGAFRRSLSARVRSKTLRPTTST